MNKFENMDVLAALEQIMRQNTAFYQGDFEIDKEMLRQPPPAIRPKINPAVDVAPSGRTFPGT